MLFRLERHVVLEGPPPEKTLRLANLFAPRKSVNNEKEDEVEIR